MAEAVSSSQAGREGVNVYWVPTVCQALLPVLYAGSFISLSPFLVG